MKLFPVIAVIFSTILFGCARQQVWEKAGSTQSDFSKDRYACMQQSQQPVSGAYVNQYGGFASSNIITNGNLFGACMNSRGWNLADKTSPEGSTPYSEAIGAIVTEQKASCSREDLQAFYRKAPCTTGDTTLDQLADRSKISADEKPALSKWRAAQDEFNKRVESIHREYNLQRGNPIAQVIEKASMAGDALALELYNGKITWGEFNNRRRELFNRTLDEFKSAAAGSN